GHEQQRGGEEQGEKAFGHGRPRQKGNNVDRHCRVYPSARKAATSDWYPGTSMRNESCPQGDSTSWWRTSAPSASSSRVRWRECSVPKRQSLSNDTARKRVSG